MISTANGTLSLSNQGTTYVVYYDEDGTTQEMQLTDAISRAQPEYLVITLGLTNLTTQSEREFKLHYTQLNQSNQAASPDTKIICQSIFPVIESQLDPDMNIDNEMIEQANSWILDVASQTSVRYLNTYEILINSEGQLVSEYCTGDGMHLSTKGGEAMLDYIRTHAYV